MKAKEKAEELFDRFYGIEPVEPIYIGMDKGQSKQCALICVDEMLKNEVNTTMHPNDSIMDYWKEVKQEIYKL